MEVETKRKMGGWKTWIGAGGAALAAVLRYFGLTELAEAVLVLSGALVAIGLGHKIEKSKQ